MCVCDKHTRTNYNFIGCFLLLLLLSFKMCFTRTEKILSRPEKSTVRETIPYDTRLQTEPNCNLICVPSSAIVANDNTSTLTVCLCCVLCTVYALRRFLLIGRHERSPLTATQHSAGSITNTYSHSGTHTYTQRRFYRAKKVQTQSHPYFYSNLQFSLLSYCVLLMLLLLLLLFHCISKCCSTLKHKAMKMEGKRETRKMRVFHPLACTSFPYTLDQMWTTFCSTKRYVEQRDKNTRIRYMPLCSRTPNTFESRFVLSKWWSLLALDDEFNQICSYSSVSQTNS